MRQVLALLGALALALLLFWGLAMMVAPPEPRETPQETMTMSVVEDVAAPAQAPEASTDIAAAAPPPPPPAAPARPAPAPQPAENVQSDIQLQTQEVSEPQAPEVEMNDDLPALEVERPEPQPKPKPEPRPSPTPPREQATPTPSSRGAQQSEQQGDQRGGTPDGATAQGGGMVQAQPTNRVQPEYPMRARRRGQEGFVEMSFTINADGSVDAGSIEVTASEPGGVFDSAARDAIRQWQFPSRDAPARTRQRLVFKLR